MTDTSEPVLDWSTAPEQLRAAYQRSQTQLQEAQATGSELEVLRRQNAMLLAGVDMAHPAAQVFVRGYEGDLDSSTIKAEWEKIVPPASITTTPAVNADGTPTEVADQLQDLQHQRQQLGTGGVAPGEEPTPDPQDAMITGFHARQARGLNRPQAEALGYDDLIAAAVAGDERVVSDSAVAATAKWRDKNFPEYG